MSLFAGRPPFKTPPDLEFSPSSAYDFFAAVYAMLKSGEGYTFDFPGGWLGATRRVVGPEAMRELRYYFLQNPTAVDLLGLVPRAGGVDRVDGFLEYLESTPPTEVARVVLAARMPESFHPLLDDILERYEGVRDEDPKLQYILRWFLRVEEREKAKVFLRFPAESKRRVLQLLTDLYERLYRAEEDKLASLFVADVERRRRAARSTGPAELIEQVTGESLPDDVHPRRVILAPSFYIRPFTLGVSYGGTRVVIYPLEIRPEEPETLTPADAADGRGADAWVGGPELRLPQAQRESAGEPAAALFDLRVAAPPAPGPAAAAPEAAPVRRAGRGRPGRPPKVERRRGRPRAGAREAASLVAVYKALGDETRLKIMRLLAERERYTQELAEALGLTHPTILHHLDLLVRAGLVSARDTERLRYYRVNEAALQSLGARIIEYLAQGRNSETT